MKKKNLAIALLLLGITSSISSQTKVDSSKIVKVLTFNILHGATTKGDFDLDKIAKVIRDANPDFVALQEVDFMTNRAKKYDLTTELGWRTKLISLFARAMPYDGGEYGEGILSKYSLSSRNVALPHAIGNEPRAALEIVTTINANDTIAFIGTHLDHTANETDRIAQAKQLNAVFASNTYPTILAGDLNAVPESAPITILEDLWTASYSKKDNYYTYPSDNPIKKIDYVLFYPKHRWKVLATKVICDVIASDHCAYLVTLELIDN